MINHLLDVVFRAATFRAAHFLPLWGALALMAIVALVLVLRRRA